MVQFRNLSQQSYQDFRYELLAQLEDEDPTPYLDTDLIPTISIGVNLRVHMDAVLSILGIDTSSLDDQILFANLSSTANTPRHEQV